MVGMMRFDEVGGETDYPEEVASNSVIFEPTLARVLSKPLRSGVDAACAAVSINAAVSVRVVNRSRMSEFEVLSGHGLASIHCKAFMAAAPRRQPIEDRVSPSGASSLRASFMDPSIERNVGVALRDHRNRAASFGFT
jgi:hypothetical protein